MRLLNTVLLMMLLVLQYRLWVGEGSFAHIVTLEEKIQHQQALNHQKQDRNAILVAEVINLQQDKESLESIESYARSQLGMVKPEESFYLVVNQTRQ